MGNDMHRLLDATANKFVRTKFCVGNNPIPVVGGISKASDPAIGVHRHVANKLEETLLGLKNDRSPAAEAVKRTLNITEFIQTTESDFKPTLDLLAKAGVEEMFKFRYYYEGKEIK